MKKSTTIFGSKAERGAFVAIEAHLPEGFELYPNLPLSQIVEAERTEISDAEWDFYLKSSVDFVLADGQGHPILAIEFDGLAGGFSYGSKYRPARLATSPSRSTKLDFKLSICLKSGLPLYVISFDEIQALPGEESLRIVNGIIAQQLVRMEMNQKIRCWDENDRGRGKTWEEMEWDLVTAQTQLQHKYDPFRYGLEPLWDEFTQLNCGWSLEAVCRPDIFEALRTKRPLESVGSKFIADRNLAVPVMLTVWVRNFAGDEIGTILSPEVPVRGGVNPLRVAENIAWYLGIKRTLDANRSSR